MISFAKPAHSMLGNLRPGMSLPASPTASPGVNSAWVPGPFQCPQPPNGVGTGALPPCGGCAHCFQTPVHPTYLALDFPDVNSLQPQLDCGAKEMKVSVDKCLLGGLGFGDSVSAYLQDRNWNCSSATQRQDGNWISVVSPAQAGACGNVLEVSNCLPHCCPRLGQGWRGLSQEL